MSAGLLMSPAIMADIFDARNLFYFC